MRGGGAALGAVLALATLGLAASASAKPPREPADCPPIRTHLGAESLFEGLPSAHFPVAIRLAGQKVRIEVESPDVLLPGQRVFVFPDIGFVHIHHPTGIHATMRLRLSALDPSGAPLRVMRRAAGGIDHLLRTGTGVKLKLPNAYPARYRLTLVVRNRGGSARRFAQNVVVPEPRFDPRLTLNSGAFHVGEPVRGRVENFGSIPIGYGYEYGLQRLEGGTWVDVPTTQDFIPLVLLGLGGGSSGVCETFEARGGFAPGTYRGVKDVDSIAPFGNRKDRQRLSAPATAEFAVVP